MKEMNTNPLILNLNTYSHYSLLSSSLSIDQIINFAIEQNQKYVALSDVNLYGAMDFYLKCKKNNLIPVIGLDVFVSNKNFLVFAKNYNGYLNLVKISSAIQTKDENFDVFKHLSDTFIIDKNGDLDLETKHYKLSEIACNEVRFYKKDDLKIFNALQMIKNNMTCNPEELLVGQDLSLIDKQEFLNRFNSEQIENLNKEIQDVNLEINFEKNNIIEYKNSLNLSSKSFLEKLCLEGMNNKILNKQIDPSQKEIYIERLNEELKVINDMGFNDYFLVVQDFVNEAKNRNILVGPGRGSAASSLVSYFLSITEVDPIKYNLLFERFLNPGRISMPDIDIDIMDARRQEIVEYLFTKYGYDHVAHIVTFQRIKAKMAIRDVGRILNKDLKEINKICKLVPSDYDENLKEAILKNKELKLYYEDYKLLFDISSEIIGCPRQIGLHAAGIVLSKKKLTDIIPIQSSVNGEIATQFSMEFLEDLGLIKMDLLGLTNLTTIYFVLKMIKMIHKIDLDLSKINLDDQKVFLDAQQGHTLGIFQLESPGMTATLKKIKPKSIEDISICSALYRPGPMQNIKHLVDRRNKKEEIEYIDIKNKDILEPTYGIIVYQEQVITLVKNIANFSPYEAYSFRRLISKKKGDELDKFKEKFYESALKNGYEKDELDKIYSYIYTFADYGFNHSHSFAYSLISYWLLYLKHYYPIEFMTTLMISVEGNTTKTPVYLEECERLKIDVLKPNINLSEKSLSLYKRKILFGFNSIKGIGEETSKKIITIRKNNNGFVNYYDAIQKLSSNGVGTSTLETLIYAGCFDCFELNRKFMLENMNEVIQVSSIWKELKDFENNIMVKECELTEEDKELFKKTEFNLLGTVFTDKKEIQNKIDEVLSKYAKYQIKPLNEIKEDNVWFDSVITIKTFTLKKTKKNTNMLFLKVIDVFDNFIEVCSFNNELIETVAKLDLSKKYLVTFKTSTFKLTLIKIKEMME